MTENEISKLVVNAAYNIHSQLAPGLLESVYETVLEHELKKLNLNIERQKPIPVLWDDLALDIGFRPDMIVNEKVIIEIKSVEKVALVHSKQLLTYLRLTNLKLGLLINFNENYIRDGITRVVNKL